MTDIKSPEKRSQNMAKIKSRNTKPEIWFRQQLFKRGYRYRTNAKQLPGHPDLWLNKYNTAIFIHGCFWHRHPGCKYAYTPKSRIEFWTKKFEQNIQRDETVRMELTEKGIRILIIWECSIKEAWKKPEKTNEIVSKAEQFLQGSERILEI